MYSKVIVGSDPRSGGADALALAAQLAAPAATILIARVFNPDLDLTVPDAPPIADARTGARPVRAELVPGTTPAHGLHQLARASGADLVVVGSSTRGRWARLILGDDVRQILRNAPCAVAVAPQQYAQRGGDLKQVGVGWNGDAGPDAALRAARDIAAAHDAYVEQATPGLPEEGLAPWSEHLDLVIVGAAAHGTIGSAVLGPIPQPLPRSLSAPLLVLPAAAGAKPESARHDNETVTT